MDRGRVLSLMRDARSVAGRLNGEQAFPAWIFGAALAGRNLPAQLLERVTGEGAIPQHEVAKSLYAL